MNGHLNSENHSNNSVGGGGILTECFHVINSEAIVSHAISSMGV